MLTKQFLRGEKVRLTAVTEEDLPTLVNWYQDPDFMRLYDAIPAVPQTKEWIRKRVENAQDSETNFIFAARPVYEEDLLGILELDGILWAHRVGSVSIAIGEKTQRSQGFGHDAMQLLLRFAFQELNLHRVQLTAFAYNERAIRLYERLGFQREGVFRQFLQRDGERHDMILYGLLSHEWAGAQDESGIEAPPAGAKTTETLPEEEEE